MFRRKRGDTTVGSLRKQYGDDFAPGFRSDAHLETVLKEARVDSLSQLLKGKGESRMARKVFYSFHYDNDCWRTQQIRNIGAIEGSTPVSSNDWEQIKRGGEAAIANWIKNQLSGRTCTIVLVGAETANRQWVRHEIIETWNAKKGVVGIRIHNLKDSNGNQSVAGPNPFDRITIGNGPSKLSSLVKLYDFSSSSSTAIYDLIKTNIADWADEAVEIRNKS